MLITDLIYDYEAEPIIKRAYPNAKFEDASDGIHESRFSVTLEEDRKTWFKFLIKEGIANISIWLQMAMYKVTETDEAHADLKAAIDELKREKQL